MGPRGQGPDSETRRTRESGDLRPGTGLGAWEECAAQEEVRQGVQSWLSGVVWIPTPLPHVGESVTGTSAGPGVVMLPRPPPRSVERSNHVPGRRPLRLSTRPGARSPLTGGSTHSRLRVASAAAPGYLSRQQR